MRFGLFLPQGSRLDLAGIDPADHWATLLDIARYAERGPFESIFVVDHFLTMPCVTDEATHEAWTLMAALAATTQRVRLCQLCTCIGYRNPAHLAKIAVTTDVISGGRVEVGVGAGWYEQEWRAYGYGFPSAGERLDRLTEGVQIMRQLWETGRACLDGRYYQVAGAVCQPLPVQPGGIPLWIAGRGERRTLRIAARYASRTNFDGDPEGFQRKSAVLARHCQQVGTDFHAIVRSATYKIVIGETERDVRDRLAWIRSHYEPLLPGDQVERVCRDLASGTLVGTCEQLVERLMSLGKLGLAYVAAYFADIAYDRSSVELFVRHVIPALTG